MEDWKQQAEKLYFEQHKGLSDIATALGRTYNSIRGFIRNHPDYRGGTRLPAIRPRAEKKTEPSGAFDRDKLLSILNTPQDIPSMANHFGCSVRVLEAHLADIEESGFILLRTGNSVKLDKTIVIQKDVPCQWNGEKIIRFGVTSDLHLCSKYQQITLLNDFYDLCEREGIDTVYDSGDMSEGYHMRRGHEHDVFAHGADDQAQYIIKNHPRRKNIKKKFILGNHDYSHVINGGHDIGAVIASARDDMEYLGMLNATIPLTPNCTMELNHPLDGASYATSYSIQKYIDSMSGGEKPNILINGHHHKALYGFYRNVHYLEAGTFQMQSGWMKGKRIAAHVGGWIVEIHVDDDGKVSRFRPEWIPYYVFKHGDY